MNVGTLVLSTFFLNLNLVYSCSKWKKLSCSIERPTWPRWLLLDLERRGRWSSLKARSACQEHAGRTAAEEETA